MIDHLSLPVSDVQRSKAFYQRALAPLGYQAKFDWGDTVAFAAAGAPDLWLVKGTPGTAIHVALRAPDRAAVQAFHREALAAGGRDNGGPGPRPQYTPTYYAAFVYDPDGHNFEAVCHETE